VEASGEQMGRAQAVECTKYLERGVAIQHIALQYWLNSTVSLHRLQGQAEEGWIDIRFR
jgi:hypothetical protein